MTAQTRSNARRLARLESKLPPPPASPAITELRNISLADAIQGAMRLKASLLIFFPASGDPGFVALPRKGKGPQLFACEAEEATNSQLRYLIAKIEEALVGKDLPTFPPGEAQAKNT